MTDSAVVHPDSSQDPPDPAGLKRKRGSFATDMLKLVSGTVFAQVVALAATPIITRLYSPEAYGVMAAFSSILSIVQVFLLLRYDQAIVLPEDDRDAANLLCVSILIGTCVTLLTSLLFGLWGAQIMAILNLSEATSYLWVMLPSLLVNVMFTAFTAWSTRMRQFGTIATGQMANALSTTGLRVATGVWGANGALALLVTNMLGTMLAAVYLGWKTLRGAGRLLRESVRWEAMVAQARRYSDQPRYGTIAMIFNSISWQLPVFLLAGFFSPAVAGQYALGQRIIRTPISLIGTSISSVYLARAATSLHDGSLASLTIGVFRRLVLFGVAPTLFLLVAAQDIFSVMFGAEWAIAGRYVQILSLWSLIWFLSTPISQLQIVLGRQQFFLYWNLVNFATRVLSLWIGATYESVELGLLLFGISGILMYGYLTIYLMNAAGVTTKTAIYSLLKNVLLYLPALSIAFLMQQIGANLWTRLLITTVLISVTFVYSARSEPLLHTYWNKLLSWKGNH